MSALLHWITNHWLTLVLIIGIASAITYISIKHKSLFYRE